MGVIRLTKCTTRPDEVTRRRRRAAVLLRPDARAHVQEPVHPEAQAGPDGGRVLRGGVLPAALLQAVVCDLPGRALVAGRSATATNRPRQGRAECMRVRLHG